MWVRNRRSEKSDSERLIESTIASPNTLVYHTTIPSILNRCRNSSAFDILRYNNRIISHLQRLEVSPSFVSCSNSIAHSLTWTLQSWISSHITIKHGYIATGKRAQWTTAMPQRNKRRLGNDQQLNNDQFCGFIYHTANCNVWLVCINTRVKVRG
jgi:hypothetical protein